MLPSKRKLNKLIKIMFYCIFGVLFFPIYRHFTIHDIVKQKQNTNTNVHIREPTINTERFIQFEKEKHVVYAPKQFHKKKKKIVHHKENVIVATITAFTANQESTGKSKGDNAYKVTASGRMVQPNLTVACPPSIPLGTWIKIQGIGRRRCDDRGGLIKGTTFDLYVESYNDAIQFGRQTRKVWIIGG